jgi:hypothetical protein
MSSNHEVNSAGPASRPRRAVTDAISLARLRGKIQTTVRDREILYHFTIIAAGLVAFVRVRFASRIFASPAELAAEFREDISRLRAIVQATVISRELWLRSRHGTFRFFRVIADGLVEIGRDGQVLARESCGAAPHG